jgi:hypothetical protein
MDRILQGLASLLAWALSWPIGLAIYFWLEP